MDQTMRKLEKSPPTNELLTNDNYPRLLITGELKAAYGYTEGFFNPVEGKVFTREDFETYVTIVSGGKAREVVQCRLGVPVHPAGGRSVQKGLHALHGYDRL